jgi:hypothetical protein
MVARVEFDRSGGKVKVTQLDEKTVRSVGQTVPAALPAVALTVSVTVRG